MKKRCFFCFLFLIILSLLTGCREPQGSDSDSQSMYGSAQPDAPEPADWGRSFLAGTPQEGASLYAVEYLKLEHGTPEAARALYTLERKVRGECFYTLCDYDTEQKSGCYLDVHVLGQGEPERTVELVPQQWGLPEGRIVSFDTTGDGYAFLLEERDAGEGGNAALLRGLQIVYTDEQGGFQSRTDLTGLLSAGQAEGILEGNIEYYRDGEGYSYLMGSGTLILVLDEEGNFVTRYDCPYIDPGRLASNIIQPPVMDQQGRLVFPVLIGGEKRVYLFGREGSSFRELGVLEEYLLGKWCSMYGSKLYYTANYNGAQSLMCWDVSTGLREKIFQLSEVGISGGQNVDLIPVGEGELLLRCWPLDEDFVVTLSERKPEYKEAVRVAEVFAQFDFLDSTVARFTRENPLSAYTVEFDKENKEAYRTRVLADMMSGGGPDILVISREDMQLLAEKGVLLPLDGLVSRETCDALLPQILRLGTIGQDLMGVAAEASVITLITSRNTWPEKEWTLDDFLTLAKEKEGLEGLLISRFGVDEESLLYNMAGHNLADSRFLDMENGVSRFEQENFMEVLEIIKRFSGAGESLKKQYDDGEFLRVVEKKVEEGSFLAEAEVLFDVGDLGSSAVVAKGWNNAVGLPGRSGSASYIAERYMVAVNANTKHPEEAAAFLEYLLSFENQATLQESMSVRGDMADRSVAFDDYYNCVEWKIKGFGGRIFPEWQDVSAFREAYNAFMQRCVPRETDDRIYDIVLEEVQSFFAGDKDALTVTRMIDNRVQNYLDEQ